MEGINQFQSFYGKQSSFHEDIDCWKAAAAPEPCRKDKLHPPLLEAGKQTRRVAYIMWNNLSIKRKVKKELWSANSLLQPQPSLYFMQWSPLFLFASFHWRRGEKCLTKSQADTAHSPKRLPKRGISQGCDPNPWKHINFTVYTHRYWSTCWTWLLAEQQNLWLGSLLNFAVGLFLIIYFATTRWELGPCSELLTLYIQLLLHKRRHTVMCKCE